MRPRCAISPAAILLGEARERKAHERQIGPRIGEQGRLDPIELKRDHAIVVVTLDPLQARQLFAEDIPLVARQYLLGERQQSLFV